MRYSPWGWHRPRGMVMKNTQQRGRSKGRECGASLILLLVVAFLVPIATFLLVSGGMLMFRKAESREERVDARAVASAARLSWRDRMAHMPSQSPPVQPPARTASVPSAVAVHTESEHDSHSSERVASLAAQPVREEKPGEVDSTPSPKVPPVSSDFSPVRAVPLPPFSSPPLSPAVPDSSPSQTNSPSGKIPSPSSPPGRSPAKPGEFQPDQPIWIVDDFARPKVGSWRVEPWANPATLSVEEEALKIELGTGRQDKSAVGCRFRVDLSTRRRILVDVRNETGQRVGIALALFTGQASTYFESEPRLANPGLNQDMAFELASSRFKCAASSWQHEARVADLGATKSLCFLIYGSGKGTVFLDNIRAVSEDAP